MSRKEELQQIRARVDALQERAAEAELWSKSSWYEAKLVAYQEMLAVNAELREINFDLNELESDSEQEK